jgi:hypothetical protein
MQNKISYSLATFGMLAALCVTVQVRSSDEDHGANSPRKEIYESKKYLEKECGALIDENRIREKEFLQCVSELYHRSELPNSIRLIQAVRDLYPQRTQALKSQIEQDAFRFCRSCKKRK